MSESKVTWIYVIAAVLCGVVMIPFGIMAYNHELLSTSESIGLWLTLSISLYFLVDTFGLYTFTHNEPLWFKYFKVVDNRVKMKEWWVPYDLALSVGLGFMTPLYIGYAAFDFLVTLVSWVFFAILMITFLVTSYLRPPAQPDQTEK